MYWGSCVCYCDLYIKSREAYSKRLCGLQGLRWMVADMKVRLDAARLLIHRAAASAATGFPSESQAAIAKTFANEAALQVIPDAIQPKGATGYSSEFPLKRQTRKSWVEGKGVSVWGAIGGARIM